MCARAAFSLLSFIVFTSVVLIGAHPMRRSHAHRRDTYTAAVVEFSTNISFDVLFHIPTQEEALQVIASNLKSLENFATEASRNNADILVFPEYGLFGFFFPSRAHLFPFLEEIPDPTRGQCTPCGDHRFNDRPILTLLSCLAISKRLSLVVNMGDTQKCSDSAAQQCPPDGWYIYNTNVVFDKDGSLIAKYHKRNLYGDEIELFNVPSPTPHTVFTTSFGVTFGTFTCYDILYCDPPLELQEMGIRNYIFPTAWGNSFPFYTSTAFQQAWSRRTKSNLLAANQHFPNKHSFPWDIRFYLTGSGLYSAGVPVSTFISGNNFPPATGQLLIGTLPKQPDGIKQWNDGRTEDKVGFTGVKSVINVNGIDMKTSRYLNFSLLDATELSGDLVASYTSPDGSLDLSCNLHYTSSYRDASETYALGAYIGANPRNPKFYYAVCSLVKCSSSDKTTCGQPPQSYLAKSVFERVALSGSFSEKSVVFPVVQLSGLELASLSQVVLEDKGLIVKDVGEPLLSASLWTRVYPPGVESYYQCQVRY